MDIWVLDRDFSSCGVFDTYESFIWSERYNEAGDFEIIMPTSTQMLDLLQEDRYLLFDHSDRLMIIETIETTTDVEDGHKLKITGRTLEAYLERRVIWGYKKYSGSMQSLIQTLLNENAINPSNSNRKIPKLTFQSSNDSHITSETVDLEFFGDNLYDTIKAICVDHGIGFKIIPDFTNDQLIFSLYYGDDHSYDQNENPWVIFSPEYENLLSTRMCKSKISYKTASFVGGEGDNVERITTEALLTEDTGYDRREMYTDASDISQKTGAKQTITDSETGTTTEEDILYSSEEYDNMLKEAGKLELSEYKVTQAFDGSVEPERQFVYARDFKLGDIVQVCDEFQQESKARVGEVVFSDDVNGLLITPSFIFSEDL